MKNITFVINYIIHSGPSRVVLSLIKALDRTRYNPQLLTLFDEDDPEIINDLKNSSITVYQLKQTSRSKFLVSGQKQFDKAIQAMNTDILHSNGFIPDLMSSKSKIHVVRISTIHNIMFNDYCIDYGKIRGKLISDIHIRALKKLDLCVCCSSTVNDVMKRHLTNCLFVRNGVEAVETKDSISRQELGIPDNASVFIYTGHISKLKRCLELTSLFTEHHRENEYLLMLGDDQLNGECQKIADKNILFEGFQKDPYKYLAVSDVYCSDSSSEGFSISVLEALSYGLGLLLSDIPSHKEVIDLLPDGAPCASFNEASFDQSLDHVRKLLAFHDKKMIKQFWEENLSEIAMTKSYEKIYSKFCG